jgi:hypothetical protein
VSVTRLYKAPQSCTKTEGGALFSRCLAVPHRVKCGIVGKSQPGLAVPHRTTSQVKLLRDYTQRYGGGLSGPVIFPRSLSQVEEAAALVEKHDLPLAIVHVVSDPNPCPARPFHPRPAQRLSEQINTGAGGDLGIDHNKNCLRFAYVFMSCRSHDLPPHPCHLRSADRRAGWHRDAG